MRYLTWLAVISILLPAVGFGETAVGQHPEEFRGTVTRSVQMKYLLFIPDGYRDDQSKKWPLIMYLHGGSRRGDEIEKHYSVDLSRVYLTGHSMGGFGTWYLAFKHPDRFAAIAPMSAPFVVTTWADRLKKMPIWAFHGSDDNLAPIGGDRDLIDALHRLGNDARFTVLPGRDHGILDTYENEELYSWLLEHARRENGE